LRKTAARHRNGLSADMDVAGVDTHTIITNQSTGVQKQPFFIDKFIPVISSQIKVENGTSLSREISTVRACNWGAFFFAVKEGT
jgi:hypothetical protein